MSGVASNRIESESGTQLQNILRVDLTEQSISVEKVPERYREQFIAGKGVGAAYLMDELEPNVDPLGEDNLLMFMFGPLTGHAPGTSRYAAVTKSPLTGTFLDSYSGGHFPASFRFALPSFYGVIFEGKAEEPVYLRVEDGQASLEDASDLWGMNTKETAREFEDDQTKVATIGPAGENEVRFATISSDEGTHHAGRGGAGAVMGSKNLKAVVATSSSPFKRDDLRDLSTEHTKRLGTSEETDWARNGGTQLIVDWTQEIGALPVHNWSEGQLSEVDTLNIDAFEDGHVGTDSCYSCPVACGHVTDFSDSEVNGAFDSASVGWGPEYESIGMLGANTDITDVTGVTELSDRADTLGMDSITLGNVISWSMEMAEEEVIDHEISFGDAEAAVNLVENIAYRDGIGDPLADGTARAAEQLGDGNELAVEAAVEVKGLELPAYDSRASFSMALAYATADRGACHQRAWPIATDALGGDRDPYSTEDHAAAVVSEQDEQAISFSVVACDFTVYGYENAAEWLDALGYNHDESDLETIGERIYNLTRLFNVREGFDSADDSLPERLKQPLGNGGPADGNMITDEEFEEMLSEYYELRGWTADGVPQTETLERLDIEDFATV